jgi:deoxyribose-phosphate aldolase
MALPPTTAAELAARCDHTLLAPEATEERIAALVAEGIDLAVASVCVTARMVPVAIAYAGSRVPVCSVVGFPSGAHVSDVKAAETAEAVDGGAAEIDVVADLGAVAAGEWDAVTRDIEAVRAACGGRVLKVIVEAGLWDPERLATVCLAAVDAGADFVKTSTGFHAGAGGATVDAVRTMAAAVHGRALVKASGGIRTTDDALAMLAAGADRIGCSATRAIVDGFAATGGR